MSNLRIGVPSKGRLSELAAELLKQAGLSFRRQDRSLFARVSEMPVEITFLRIEDIPVLCAEGAIDMGITGSDLLCEAGVEVDTRLALGGGKCRLALCVPDDSRYTAPADLDGRRVATSFPRVTEAFLREHNAHVHLVPISGSVEVMVALGVADAIVDLVETGSTLAANRLRILEEIGQYETILIQNRDRREAETADRVVRRLEGVVIARAYSLLEYNVPLAKLPEAEKITPGFKSPTVSRLEDPDWVAVRVMVPRSSEPTRQTERLCEESLSCHSFPTDSDGRRRGCAAESRPTATSSIGAWPRIGNDLQVWRESGEPATRFPCDFAQWQQFCTRNIRIAAIHPHWISLE